MAPDSTSPLPEMPRVQARDRPLAKPSARSILANPHSAWLKLSCGPCRHRGRYLLCPSHTGSHHSALQSTNTSGGV